MNLNFDYKTKLGRQCLSGQSREIILNSAQPTLSFFGLASSSSSFCITSNGWYIFCDEQMENPGDMTGRNPGEIAEVARILTSTIKFVVDSEQVLRPQACSGPSHWQRWEQPSISSVSRCSRVDSGRRRNWTDNEGPRGGGSRL